MKRLQGEEFHSVKQNLRFMSYCESLNGHIRVNLRDKNNITPTYFHWLNPEEEKKFKESSFYGDKNYIDNTVYLRKGRS